MFGEFLGLRILQFSSLVLAIFVFIMKFKIFKCSEYKNKYQIPWLIWIANFIAFYTLHLADLGFNLGINELMTTPDFFTMWSGILRFHMLGTLFSYSIIHKPFYKGGKK